jgi:aspartyl-tRNA(Asn)/glutamyl-tRNA(Gln) amidotransferase subunit B
MNYETIIGLEVHVQLRTKSKMYCRCSADYANTPPNTHVCPVCLGMPGVLPVINRQAVEYTIMTALALHCPISEYTKFDRKNYPYPDLMKGYQISQYDAPIGRQGWLTIQVDGQEKKAGITRVHLEEDVAKLVHRTSPDGETYSLVDVNRSGVPLMEIVGEPDLRSPEEAREYLTKLRSILQYLGVSTANMEEGSFRCDANISIRPEGSREYMPKVEVKNMNSFRAVYRAMEYEAKRQRRVAEVGERLIQETRGWVEEKGQTVSQRTKEYAHDYRYFPEPDLPPLSLDRKWVEEIKAKLPELPEARRNRFITQYGLSPEEADSLTSTKEMADYEEDLIKTMADYVELAHLPLQERAKLGSNWLLNDVNRIVNTSNTDIAAFRAKVSPQKLAKWVALSQSVTNVGSARFGLEETFKTGKSADDIVREKGLSQISDTGAIEQAVVQVINSNPQAVSDYRAGKETAIKFLVGQVMKATRGRANPQMVNELLKKKLTGE